MLRLTSVSHRAVGRVMSSPSNVIRRIRRYSSVSHVKRTTIYDLKKKYAENKPLTLVTSYSAYESTLIEKSDAIDAILVGDSCGMVVAGGKNTTGVTMDDMVYHCRAASSSVKKLFVIGDMPFGSFEASDEEAVRNAIELVKRGRVDAVKLEGGTRMAKRVQAITDAGIAVMGHIGLTPQSQSAMGGFRVQGRSVAAAIDLIKDAKALEKAGCFAIVLECVPEFVAEAITANVRIPTIGIGAGNKTSGQILVFQDMFGLFSDFQPKFTKRFRDAGAEIVEGLKDFSAEVASRAFPASQHTYNMLPGEEEKLRRSIGLSNRDNTQTQHEIRKRRIAVIGGGAMGSLFAGRLALRNQNDVWIVSSWRDHVRAINSDGLELRSPLPADQPSQRIRTLRATDSPSEVVQSFGGPADLALVMVKSGQTDVAALKAAEILGATQSSFALTLQNGLGNAEILASRLGAHRVLQGITSHGAMMISAGIVEHTGSGFLTLANPSGIHLGTNHPSPEDALKAMLAATDSTANLLTDAGFKVDRAPTNMESLVWGKLVVNSVINPLTALMGVKNGELLRHPEALYIIHKAVDEACRVARARGVELPWSDPFETVVEVIRQTSQNKSSMLQDVLRGQDTEIEAINGAIVQEAKRVGIDAYVNKSIVKSLHRGQFRPDPSNAARLAAEIVQELTEEANVS
eukprot:TRINITY_DN1159_c0_g1_i1.p2 TRINITY_DN1159_c0_g1~~TRINITY_DN1159_c0_g1_i1.p2  ORF type:complete len:687 (-),score=82.52 TRINITY_DN1159_c0_g1_i1:172-2232(-)